MSSTSRNLPESANCPKHFCSHWIKPGDRYDSSGAEYDSVNEAVEAATVLSKSGRCGCVFGKCSRDSENPGTDDWYEPDEHRLRKEGLPDDYFVRPGR